MIVSSRTYDDRKIESYLAGAGLSGAWELYSKKDDPSQPPLVERMWEERTIIDIVEKGRKFGHLTDKQRDYVRNLLAQRAAQLTPSESPPPEAKTPPTPKEGPMNDVDTANTLLDFLSDHSWKWYSTTELHSKLGTQTGRPSWEIRDVLHKLSVAGTVHRQGKGQYKWKINDRTWNRVDPFGTSAMPQGPASDLDESRVVELIRKHAPQGDVSQQLEALLKGAKEELLKSSAGELSDKAVAKALEKFATEAIKKGIVKATIKVEVNGEAKGSVEGKTHAQFDKVLKLAAARRNVMLIGPAGCGKSHLCEQVAQALGLPFSDISCSAGMSEGQLLGRLLPTGKGGQFVYSVSSFVERYEKGGVMLLDELDGADANTLVVLHSALANGHLSVPNRIDNPVAKRHKDFVCIAAANTFGTGADRMYVGRNQLDEATLDRFRIGQVEMDYDKDVEAELCPDDGLRTRLQGYRAKVREAKLRRVVSMRFVRDAYMMKAVGFTDKEVDDALFAGWSADEVRKVKGY